jgi:hypothetical protein
MGIKANNSRDTLDSVQFFGLTALNNIVTSATLASSSRVGASRNIFASDAGIDAKSSMPAGARHPVAWQMPQEAGGLASHNNTKVSASSSGFAVLGLPGSGSSTITFTPTATGGLVVSGSGSATITFSPTGSILSIASGSGSATITLTPTALIGALAGISGQGTISCTPSALISAIGYLAGLSTNETEFSADALARAVWDATASSFTLPGTMGEKLNDAGSAGNPWAALLASNNSAGTFGEFVQNLPAEILDLTDGVETGSTVREALRIILAALAGKISGAGTNTISIRDVNDTKDRIVATVDSNGNRTAVTLDES